MNNLGSNVLISTIDEYYQTKSNTGIMTKIITEKMIEKLEENKRYTFEKHEQHTFIAKKEFTATNYIKSLMYSIWNWGRKYDLN